MKEVTGRAPEDVIALKISDDIATTGWAFVVNYQPIFLVCGRRARQPGVRWVIRRRRGRPNQHQTLYLGLTSQHLHHLSLPSSVDLLARQTASLLAFVHSSVVIITSMSVLVIVLGRKCTLAASRAAPDESRHGAPHSALRHSRSTIFSSVQHDKLLPTSIFVRRPSCLELTARTFATNHFNRTFQALSKHVLFGQIARWAH